jgi:restriction system protein
MAVWMVRAGRNGEREDTALDKNLAVIGWDSLPDLTTFASRENLEAECRRIYPNWKPGAYPVHVGQLWAFRDRIQVGDLLVLPLKTRAAIAIGKVTGPYRYEPDLPDGAHHTRPVQWLRTDIPRSAIGQDILYSLGASMTVCQIERNNAEQRITAVLNGQADPGMQRSARQHEATDAIEGGLEVAIQDLEEYARDQIRAFINTNFTGHDLPRLIESILMAQGYRTRLSPAGPDGGVDILAGHGVMGFDAPRLCVQVKSGESPVDVGVLRELQGVMRNFGAQHGLLVAWGGFRSSVLAEARRLFFEIRLWDSNDVLNSVFECYVRLPAELQAELPLKRVWALVPEGRE